MSDFITIRPVTSVEECVYFQQLERRIWLATDEDIMPIHTLITCIKNGGLILGAFSEDGPPDTGGMIGATFGWPGVDTKKGANKLKFCSHMAGVLPEWQGQGLSTKLKLAQRRAILDLGYTDWITWTYDPLYRVNGILNIHRLGATCNTYYPNNYGVMTDALNAGVPSDRCQVDWFLNSERAQNAELGVRSAEYGMPRLLPTEQVGEFVGPVEIELRLAGEPVAVPVPEDIAAIRRSDGALSMAWRMYMRSVLETAFAAGYAMVDCAAINGSWYYVLAPT